MTALLASNCRPVAQNSSQEFTDKDELINIEKRIGGRLGVFALDTGNERSLALRADERFAMCSVFKWMLAGAVLAAADRGELNLNESLTYSANQLMEHSPVTTAYVSAGALSIDSLAEATVTVSDNTAANLLLARLGGPAAVTAFARSLGDPVTRLDRDEPSLNENQPGDPRDTSSPRAMVASLREALLGHSLSSASQSRLLEWLRGCSTGATRLRAGLPTDWLIGNKTGSGARNAVNDVAIVHPPGRAPLLIAVFTSESDASLEQINAGIADVGRLVVRRFG